MIIIIIYVRPMMYENSDWSKAYSQYTMVCEVDKITQYLLQIIGYHVEFKVCLVSNPFVCEVFPNVC